MSTEIDNEVVKMEFDNSDFEADVAKSMSTLDRLKDALHFDKISKSIGDTADQMQRLDVSKLNASAQTVQDRFSGLSVIATGALMRIGDMAVDTGLRMARSLTVDPLIAGFQEYEMTMNSVKTIMANLPEETIDNVNNTLNTLNQYADETIYSFTDMTRAIGQFTAAGVKLKPASTAIKGLSNIAAGAGANNTALARAEYQVSQALQAGVIRLMDWNSLVQAGMANPELQSQLMATARAHGVAIDAMIAKEGSFRDSLNQGWLTSDIFLETMERAASTDNEWGKRLTDAATQVNTFSQLISVLSESVGSSWTNTWQAIIGDYAQSKELFTGLYNIINPAIDAMGDFRLGVLKTWSDLGGRTNLFNGVKDGLQGILNFFEPISSGLSNLFGGSGSVLADVSKSFADSMAKFKDWTSSVAGVFKPVEQAAKPAAEATEVVTKAVQDLDAVARQVIQGDWGNGDARIQKLREAGYSFEAVQNKVNELLGCTKRYEVAAEETTSAVTEQALATDTAGGAIEKQAAQVEKARTSADNYRDTISGVFSALDIFKGMLDVVGTAVGRVFGIVGRVTGSVAKVVLAITGGIGRVITAFRDLLDTLGIVASAKDIINAFFDTFNGPLDMLDALAEGAANVVGNFFDVIANGVRNAAPQIKRFGEFLAPIIGVVTRWLSILKDAGGKLLSNVFNGLGSIKDNIGKIFGNLKLPDLSKIAAVGNNVFSTVAKGASKFIDVLKKALGVLKDFAITLGGGIVNGVLTLRDSFVNFATGVGATLEHAFGITTAYAEEMNDSSTSMQESAERVSSSTPIWVKAFAAIGNVFDSIGKAIKIEKFTKAISKALSAHSLGDVGKAIGAFAIDIKNAIVAKLSSIDIPRTISSFFSDKVVPTFKLIGEKLRDGIAGVKNNLPGILKTFVDTLDAFGTGIRDALDALVESVAPVLTDAHDAIKSKVDDFVALIKDIIDGIAGSFDDVNQKISDVADNDWVQNLINLFGAATALNLAKSIESVTGFWRDLSKSVKNMAKAVKKFANGINNIGKAAKWGAIALMFIAFASAVGKIADAITVLGKMDPAQLEQGMKAIGIIVGVLAGALAVIEIYKSITSKLQTKSKTLEGADNPVNTIVSIVTSFKSALAAGSMGLQIAAVAGVIAAFALLVKGIADAVVKLGTMDTGVLLKGLFGVAIIAAALVRVMKSLSKVLEAKGELKNTFTLLQIAAMIGAVAWAFKSISQTLRDNDMQTTIGALAILGGAITALGVVSSKLGGSGAIVGNPKKNAVGVAILCLALIPIAKAIDKLSTTINSNGISQVAVATALLSAVLGELGFIATKLGAISASSTGAVKSAASLLILCYSLTLIADAIVMIPDPMKAVPVVAMLGTLLGELAFILAQLVALPETSQAIGVAFGLATVVGALALVIAAASQVENASQAVVAIGVAGMVVIALALVVRKLIDAPDAAIAIGPLVGLAAVAVGLAALVKAASGIPDPQGAALVIAAAGGVAAAMLIAITAFAEIAPEIVAVASGAMLAIGKAVDLLGDGIQKAGEGFQNISTSIQLWNTGDLSTASDNIKKVMTGIGEALRDVSENESLFEMVGSLFNGGAIGAAMAGLGMMGETIGNWKDIDPAVIDNMGTIIGKVGDFMQSSKSALTGWLNGQALADSLRGIGEAGKSITEWNNIDDSGISHLSTVLGKLQELIGVFKGTFTDAVGAWFTGGAYKQTMEGIGSMSADIASWNDITDDGVTKLQNTLDGIKTAFTGFQGFWDEVGSLFVGGAINAVGSNLGALAEGANQWAGVPDVGKTIQNVLLGIGGGLVSFNVTTMIGFDPNRLTDAAAGLSAIASMASEWRYVSPETASTITKTLVGIGVGLAGFSLSTFFADPGKLADVADPLSSIASAAKEFGNVNSDVSDTIGKVISAIGTSVGGFPPFMQTGALTDVGSALPGIATAVRSFDGVDQSLGSTIGYILANIATNVGYFSGRGDGASIMSQVAGPLTFIRSAISGFIGIDGSVGSTVGYILANIATNVGYFIGREQGAAVIAQIATVLPALAAGCVQFMGVDGANVAASLTQLSTALSTFTGTYGGIVVAAIGLQLMSSACANLTGSAFSAATGLTLLSTAGRNVGTGIMAGSTIGMAGFVLLATGSAMARNALVSNMASASAGVAAVMLQIVATIVITSALMATQASQSGTKAGQNFVNGIRSAIGPAHSAAMAVVNAAVSAFNSVGALRASEAGHWFAMGYARGISSGTGAVAAAARNLANRAMAAVNQAQATGSPARKLIIAGKWFSAGYGVGIVKNLPMVAKNAKLMAEEAIASANTATTNGSLLTPTLTPIISTQSIQNGTAKLASALDSQIAATGSVSITPDYSPITDRMDTLIKAISNLEQPLVGSLGVTAQGYTAEDIGTQITDILVDALEDGKRKAEMNRG